MDLCDQNRTQITRLTELKYSQPSRDSKGRKLNRKIHIYQGGFNNEVDEMLGGDIITEKEATLCLLDQRTFECHWQSIEKLASYEKSGNKIEQFYFLANGWLERALAAQKDTAVLARWWGRDAYRRACRWSRLSNATLICSRSRTRLRTNRKDLFRNNPAHIFEQDEEVHGICRVGDEIKMFVETSGLFVFCMHSQGAYTRDLGGLQRALHRIP